MDSSPIHILLVEDNPGDARLVRELVHEAPDLEIHHVQTLADGLAYLDQGCSDVVLLDLGLPDSSGMDTLRSFIGSAPSLPVVVLTGQNDEELGRLALREGAQDYLVKGMEIEQVLTRAVRYAIERKRSQVRLMEQNATLGAVLESTDFPIFAIDADYRYTGFNQAHALTRKAASGVEIRHGARLSECFADPADWLAMKPNLDRALLGESIVESVHAGPEGLGRRTYEIAYHPVHVEAGEILGVAVFSRDVTERARSQERDRFARDLLELLNRPDSESNQIRDILQLIKKSTGIEAVAIRLKEGEDFPYFLTNGFPAPFVELERTLCVRDDFNCVLRDDQGQPILECMCGNILRGRTNPEFPFFTEGGSFWSNRTSDLLATTTEEERQAHTRNRCNSAGYESVALIPLRGRDGIIGLLQFNDHRRDRFDLEMIQFFEGMGASIGIALSRSQAQEDLRRSATRWSATFDAIADIVCVLSPEHEFLEINRAGCLALGLERDQIIGRKCYELVHGTAAPIPGCPCMRSLATRAPANAEHQEGEKFYSLVTWPSLGTSGQVISMAHTIKDISSIKQAQVQHDLLEEQLRASQKMEAIGSLAGGVAHDFNNLLSVILSYTGLAMDSLLEGDPLKEDLVEVQKAGERAAGLTRQLLAFSRKQVLQPSVLDVNEITSGLEKMLRRILGEDVELVQVLEPELGRVMADQGQLEQVLMNLVVNARDAMPAGGRLTIETSNIEVDGEYASRHMGLRTGPYVQIAVSDSGCGMDEAVRARIFEPFFTTKEKGKGTGLGLAMVYGIVQQSGGAIGVSSKPGHGTTFRIYLPRDVSGDAAPDLVPASPTRKTTGTETILVVEDEDALRKVIHRALSGGGYNVMTAAEGEEALRICARHAGEIHLLLTDVVMPKMSGRELAHALTADRPTTRVLYMSGYTGNTILHHGDFDAETQFLAKPFTMAGLMSKIRAVLD